MSREAWSFTAHLLQSVKLRSVCLVGNPCVISLLGEHLVLMDILKSKEKVKRYTSKSELYYSIVGKCKVENCILLQMTSI